MKSTEALLEDLDQTLNALVREFLSSSSSLAQIQRPGRVEVRLVTWLRFYPTDEALLADSPVDGRILRRYEQRDWRGPSADVECVDTGSLFHVYFADCKELGVDEVIERDARRALNERIRKRGKRG